MHNAREHIMQCFPLGTLVVLLSLECLYGFIHTIFLRTIFLHTISRPDLHAMIFMQ